MNSLRRVSLIVLVLLGLSLAVSAVDITTLDGAVYRNCVVTAVEPDALVFRHKDGSARVTYDKLPPEVKTKYFDPEKVEAYLNEQKEAREAAQRARDEAAAKERKKEKDFVDEARRREQRGEQEGALREQEEVRQMGARPENVRRAALGVAAIVGVCVLVWFAFNKPGPVLVLIGVMTAIYFWNFYETTEAGQPGEDGKETRVESPALVQKRRAGTMVGGLLFLAGVLVSAVDGKGKRAGGEDE